MRGISIVVRVWGFFIILLASSCTNQVLSTLDAIKNGTGITQSDGNTGASLTLSKVVPNSYDTNQILDLIGNGTGEIGKSCTLSGNSSNNCQCHFQYTRNGSTEKIESSVSYVEDDLIRCSKSIVPADITTLTVKIHITNSDSYSNAIILNLSGSTLAIDTADYRNFNSITRWQCRDLPFSPMPWKNSGVYDPIISDDPKISIPLNFYFESKGRALLNFVSNPDAQPAVPAGGGSAVVGWYCPEGNKNYTHAAADLWLYSVGTADLGSIPTARAPSNSNYNLGFSQTGLVDVDKRMDLDDRQGFSLARQPTGVWSMPINAYIAPNTISGLTEINGQKVAPLGYGASPNVSGTNEESCPTVTIPSGYHWVKVWLYRGSIEPRKYPTSPALKNTALAMNMPNWSDGSRVFESCNTGVQDFAGNEITTILTGLPATQMANRLISVQGQADVGCMQWRQDSGGADIYDPKTYFSTTGTDNWRWLKANGIDYDTIYAQVSTPASPPGNFFPYPGSGGTSGVANGNHISMPVEWENLETNSRFDYVMVTTPTNIHAKNMMFPYATDYAPEYVPYRFKNDPNSGGAYSIASKCAAGGGTWGDNTGCSTAVAAVESEKIYYDIKLHDVGVNGDSAPGRQPVFPVCAIQKDTQ